MSAAPATHVGNDVTEDAFLGGALNILQLRNGYRAGLDAVMLAAAVPADQSRPLRVLDVGAGVGTAGLCLARRAPFAEVVLLEKEPLLAALAAENIARNDLAARVRVVTGVVGARGGGVARAGPCRGKLRSRHRQSAISRYRRRHPAARRVEGRRACHARRRAGGLGALHGAHDGARRRGDDDPQGRCAGAPAGGVRPAFWRAESPAPASAPRRRRRIGCWCKASRAAAARCRFCRASCCTGTATPSRPPRRKSSAPARPLPMSASVAAGPIMMDRAYGWARCALMTSCQVWGLP